MRRERRRNERQGRKGPAPAGAGRRRHRAGDHGGDARRAARGRRQIRARAAIRERGDRLDGAQGGGLDVSRCGGGQGEGGGRRAARPDLAQRLSAARPRRAQSVGRNAQAARALRQYPSGQVARGFPAALRQTGRSRHRAREHRGLLRRPFDASRPRRIHADAGSGDGHTQDHARRFDAHRGSRVQAGNDAAQASHRRAQGQCVARLGRAFSRMHPRGGAALQPGQIRRAIDRFHGGAC